MASNVGDMDVFFRSMSARGQLGGLSTATGDAITALDAFGKDRIVVETVGAGQNEVDIVRTADTVVVLVQPGSGDDVQMLKAGILEIGDVFVVNKADMDGAATTVTDLREMLHLREGSTTGAGGHHGLGAMGDGRGSEAGNGDASGDDWDPQVVETVATEDEGVAALIGVLDDHYAHLRETGELGRRERTRYAEKIRQLLRADAAALLEDELDRHGGIDALVDEVQARETDPYTVADRVLEPLVDCVEGRRE
jgi:LAO/AO transport system kinase